MVVLGLGSNQGNRLHHLRTAINQLRYTIPSDQLEVFAISPIYESEALLPEGAPNGWDQAYLNVNLLCETSLDPQELLQYVKGIETQIGRKNRGRWAPREIDIDLLVMGDQGQLNYQSETLQIPHPGLLHRPFALLPLIDLIPNWKIASPGKHRGTLAKTYAQIWRTSEDQIPFRTRRSHHFISELVGILNLTPDSFSDGGLYLNSSQALAHLETLVKNEVTVVDIGGESTRPGAQLISTEEEWNRVEPILKLVPGFNRDLKISMDTRNPEIASRALQMGAHWINDVSGLRHPKMIEVIQKAETAKIVLMHSLSVPPKKGESISSELDPIQQLMDWAQAKIKFLNQNGINNSRILFDPGLGFGKTAEQSWEILRRAHEFHQLKVPLFIGHSRKSFLATLTPLPAVERDLETSIISVELVKKGIHSIRIHHSETNLRALKTWSHLDGVSRW